MLPLEIYRIKLTYINSQFNFHIVILTYQFDLMQLSSSLSFSVANSEKYSCSTPASIRTGPSEDPFSPPPLNLEESGEWEINSSEDFEFVIENQTKQVEEKLDKISLKEKPQKKDYSILSFLSRKAKQREGYGRNRLRSSDLDENLKEKKAEYKSTQLK